MKLKNTIIKFKSLPLYKPMLFVGLAGVAVVLVFGSATIARVLIDSSYDTAGMPNQSNGSGKNDTLYEYDEYYADTVTATARGGTKVSILKKDAENVTEVGYDNGTNVESEESGITENTNLGQADAMDNLEYNIVKQILAELSRDDAASTMSTQQMSDMSNKYNVSLTEMENLVKKFQSQNTSSAEAIKSELGVTEQQLKTMIKQIESNVASQQKTIEQKINSFDKKASEMIANQQTLSDKQVKELSSKIGVSEKDLKDYINKQADTVKKEAQVSAENAAKAAADPKADKTYVDAELKNKITMQDAKDAAAEATASKADKTYVDTEVGKKISQNDLKTQQVVTATYDEDTNTLTFSQVK